PGNLADWDGTAQAAMRLIPSRASSPRGLPVYDGGMERTLLAPPARGVGLLCLCLAAGCAAAPPRLPPAPPPAGPVTGVVFCADAAGGFGYPTETLPHTVAQERLGLRVVYAPWSHGTGRMFADNSDWCNVRTQARQVAAEVRSVRERDPALPIYFVGHSAGC